MGRTSTQKRRVLHSFCKVAKKQQSNYTPFVAKSQEILKKRKNRPQKGLFLYKK